MKPPALRLLVLFSFLVAFLSSFVRPLAADATQDMPPPYKNPATPVEARVEDLLGRLSWQEKLTMLGGTGFTTQPVKRLDVPAFKMSDASVGARGDGPTTAYTASLMLAAAWDTDLAMRVGASIGRDCRARGVHILLGPGINLYRAPMCGRNFEYLGEDPLLAGKTAAAYIRGVQSQGVASTVKHYAANNQEFDRHGLSSDIDEQTLHELYLRNFQIAVREGQPKCVMTAYNPINGMHASQNRLLNVDILKGEFGFRGMVMSDWSSCYDTAGMALGGLDLEMPRAVWYKADKVQALLDAKAIAPEVIDDKIRRQLRVGFEMGWFDRPQRDSSIPRDDPAGNAVVLDEARQGIVLLKNKDNLLPLDRTKLRHVVVVGPNGDHPVIGGGGSAYTVPFRAVSVVDALKTVVGEPEKVTHADWRLDAAPSAETLRQVGEADAVVVSVGFDWPGVRNAGPDRGQFGDQRKSYPPQAEGEGDDRAYAMPPGTSEMIRAVAAANPRTVVVLNAGGSVETASWIDSAAGLIHAFYPGQSGNTALAEILFGQINPSGKLPFSWEKRWEDSAAYGHYPDAANAKSNDYREGLLLGYRWFDAKKIEPLYPFGFGLNYTQFELANFRAAKGTDGKEIRFTVDVCNAGRRAGAEVVQVYVDRADGQSPARPAHELKAFGKVFLQPGETKTVTMTLDPADLATWDPATHRWAAFSGAGSFLAGDFSRNLPLHASLSINTNP